MKKMLLTTFGCLCLFSASAQSTFTPGNIVVLQTSGTVSKASSAVTLKEFTTSGTPGISVAIPATGPTPFQSAGIFGGSEGFLTTSTDGRYLVLAGYATSANIADITATSSTSVLRTVGLVYPSGFYLQFDTSSTFFSVNDIRGAISDGTNFWAGGASNANTDGINYFGPGTDAPLATGANPPKAYGLRIFNGQIYYSTQKAGPSNSTSQLGIFSVGTGLPVSNPTSVAQVINTGTVIPEDFSISNDGATCYIAINVNTAAGGIQKWTKSGGIWSLAYTLGTGIANTGAYGLVVDYSGANPVIYATTFDAAGNRVIKITDVGSSSPATTLVAAVANVYYKGISFAPVASGTPKVNLSVSSDTASEAGYSIVTITANASSPVTGNQTVTLGVSGTGITSGDYTLSNTTITIPNGATSGSVTFTVQNDILGEGTEVANLSISAPTSGIVLGMRTTQRITIFDNDGNNHPVIGMNVTGTTDFIDGGVAVPPPSPFKLSGVINDPTDPGKTLGVSFMVTDLETSSTALTVTAISSNTTAVPNANLVITGTDTFRTLRITPAAVGYANITVTVSDGIDITTYVINYAASAASGTPASTFWHTGISDASDAIAIDDNYYITGDDELNVLNVYSRSASGLPVLSYNYTSNLALPDPAKPEVDIEAAATSINFPHRVYWLGSMSNGKDPFDNKPNRDRIFATTYSGTGAGTTFTFGGYATLRSALLAWGDANGYSFTASAAAGVDSKSPSGFAAEGMVFAPDSTTLYIGLRAPLVPTIARTKAVIAPIKNFETWFNAGSPIGSPVFGTPIELDLGGRGIRDITRLSNGSYVIIAGSPGGALAGAIYKWTGKAGDAPIQVSSPLTGALNMEGVMQVNTGGLLSLSSLQVISDGGDDVYYGDGTVAKDFGDLIYRKFRSDVITSIDLSYPEINLTGNAVTITDGDITPSVTDNTDFGNVNTISPLTKNFVIQNLGSAVLSVSAVNFTGAAAADFSLSGAPAFPWNIAPNSSQTISVMFTPHAGVRNATMNIVSNDADEATYDVALLGNGICTTPAAIAGNVPVCTGKVLNLIDAGGGTWVSDNTAKATVGSSSGIVTGISTGTANITYTLATGCNATTQVTVNQSPGAITGTSAFCQGNTSLLSDPTLGGAWSSATTLIATVGSSTGMVTGIAGGITTISYTVPNGCFSTNTVTVNALPSLFTVTGGGHYCAGTSSTLSVGLNGSAVGINYQLLLAGTPTGAPLAGTGGLVSFGIQSAQGIYTVMATNIASGCSQLMAGGTAIIIDPAPVPQLVTGGGHYCTGDLAAAPHIMLTGSQTGINYKLYRGPTFVLSVAGTGLALDFGQQSIAAIYTVIAQDNITGCLANMPGTATVTIDPLPAIITGNTHVCEGSTTILSSSPAGTWSSAIPAIAAAGSGGVISGVSPGTSVITYTLPTGCFIATIVTVDPLPSVISGTATVCAGLTTNLTDAGGGTWTSANLGVATIGSSTGVLTGISAGVSTISYVLPTGCTATKVATVNALPAAIAGTTTVCESATTTLTDAGGGTWTSAPPVTAIIGSSTGILTGVAAGTTVITYTLPTGCITSTAVTVNPLPAAISGTASVCVGAATTLTDAGGGTWTSADLGVAAIGSSTGILNGISAGVSTISYVLSTGCMITKVATVNALPAAIAGTMVVCESATTTLTDVGGGTWTSANPGTAIIGSITGIVTGISAGTAPVTYTLPTGCIAANEITVNPLPAAIAGTASLCVGATTTLTDAGGGSWTSGALGIASVGSSSGTLTGIAPGIAMITYSLPTGCSTQKEVTVNVLPVQYSVIGGGSYCAGGAGRHVNLSASETGINYQLYNGATAVGAAHAGTGTGLDFGAKTVVGSYTVTATNAITGCNNDMTGSVSISITPLVVPSVSLSASPAGAICQGTLKVFMASAANGGSEPVYTWKVNGIVSGYSESFSYTPANGDIVTVAMASNAICPSLPVVTASETESVGSLLMPVVNIIDHHGPVTGSGMADTLVATVTNAGSSPMYQWKVNSSYISGATASVFISSVLSDKDTVTCYVTSVGACGGYVGANSAVIDHHKLIVNNVANSKTIVVSPNPSAGTFTIKGTMGEQIDEEVTIEVLNMLSQVVYKTGVIKHNGNLDEQVMLNSSLANGRYILNLRSESGSAIFSIIVNR